MTVPDIEFHLCHSHLRQVGITDEKKLNCTRREIPNNMIIVRYSTTICHLVQKFLRGTVTRTDRRIRGYRSQFVLHRTSNSDQILLQTTNSVVLVRKRTIQTKRPPLVGEVSANFCE
jgi:hypothetical protein